MFEPLCIIIKDLLTNLFPFLIHIHIKRPHHLFLQVCGAYYLRRFHGEASNPATSARLLARWLQLLLPSFAVVGDRHESPRNFG